MTDRPPPRRSAPSFGAENAAPGARASGRSQASAVSESEAQRAFLLTLGLSVVLSVGLGLVVVLLIHGPDQAPLRETGPRTPAVSVGITPRIPDPVRVPPISVDVPPNPPAAEKAAETAADTTPAPSEETLAVPESLAAGRRNALPAANARRPRVRPIASPTISIPDSGSPTFQPDLGVAPPSRVPAPVDDSPLAPSEGSGVPVTPGSEVRN